MSRSITSLHLRFFAAYFMAVAITAAFSIPAFCQEDEKATFTVKVTDARAIKPDKPGATSVRVKATIEVKNEGSAIIGVSSRALQYKLVKKGKTKDKDEPHPVFGHIEPDLRDSRPLEGGKSTKLMAELEGSSVIIEKSAKYELQVKGFGKEKSVPLDFKFE